MTPVEQLASEVVRRRQLPQPEMRRAIRLSAGLTLDDMASALGCTRQAVSNWETGRRSPGKAHRDSYLEALLSLKELG